MDCRLRNAKRSTRASKADDGAQPGPASSLRTPSSEATQMLASRNPENSSAPKRSVPMTRRRLLTGIGLAAGTTAAALAIWRPAEKRLEHHGFSLTTPRTAEEALARLRAGNQCYIEGHFAIGNLGRTGNRRPEITPAQHPYPVGLA